ncbi:MAG: ATP-dependent DNA helicase DinG [Bacteriovoracaceae bacterium]|jgi:ATP-dependent DNA helicase DinG
MHTNHLGRWTVIDIETTGINPANDSIIDIGFLEFDGTALVRKYDSLVRHEGHLSYFIQKLTSIKPTQLKKAPRWEDVELEVQELYGSKLIAHNSDFEKSFLEASFDEIEHSADEGEQREEYLDSMLYLALLFPERSNLKLEGFITDFGLADKEEHRGFQDSLDLLKVLLLGTYLIKSDSNKAILYSNLFKKYAQEDWWYAKFYMSDREELFEIAESIDFDLVQAREDYLEKQIKEIAAKTEDNYVAPPLTFSGENIKEILRDEMEVSKKLPFYRYRKSQEDLALKTGQSFKNKIHSLVQAPTGTGKTLGYLLPSALFSLQEKQQVLVATGTKTLQHQALSKDVPQIRSLLNLNEEELKVKRLIGSGNHLCELLFREGIKEDLLFDARDFEVKFTDMYFEALFYYNSYVPYEEKVVRDNLPYALKRRFKNFAKKEQEIAVDFRSCTGKKCPFRQDCSYLTGLREAKDANIILGNHSLMFSWPRGFPRPPYVVVDEAHKIEEETTSSFSLEVSQPEIENFVKSLQNLQGVGSLFFLLAQFEEHEGASTDKINMIREKTLSTHQMLEDHLKPLPDLVELYFKKRPRYTSHFWNEVPMVGRAQNEEAAGVGIFNHFDSIRHILNIYIQDLMPFSNLWEVNSLEDDNQIIALTRFETFWGQLEDFVTALTTILDKKEGFSHSLKFHESQGYQALAAPIDVGRVLHDKLLETSASVVYTSATLGNGHGDRGTRGIEWSTGYSYLEAEKRFKSGFFLPATYDYANKTKVYLCDDTLPFYDNHFVEDTLSSIIKLIRNIGGRSLLLFSARKRFETAREILLKEFEGEIPLFIQGMGSNIIDEFKNSGVGILLGMESFGEGIDVPGEALQFVFIDKIPDLRMDKVINDRRNFYEANLGNEFTDYYLAHRTRSLHQKLGRLLRTESDIGGVIIVDSRIKNWKGNTMEKLVKLMEPYQIQRSGIEEACAGVHKFIDEFSS